MTLPTFASYTPPDVYVADTTTPIVLSTGTLSSTMAIAGPALGYRTATQSFLIYASQAAQLTFTGVFTMAQAGPPAIAAPVVTLSSTAQALTAGTDYTLTTVPDPSGNAALAITTVTRVSTSANVSDGDQVSIQYNYADITYYQPQVFTNFQSVVNAYGAPLVSTAPSAPGASQVANPLSFAAQVAFTNGANTLVTIALNPADGDLEEQLEAAYGKVGTTYGANILVPVFSDDLGSYINSGTVAQFCVQLAEDLNAACTSATGNGFPQIGFFGTSRDYSESDISIPTFAADLSSERLVLVYPEMAVVFNGLTGQSFNCAGCYLAVALGAILSTLPVNTGLTRQGIAGFSGLTAAEQAAMTPGAMNTIAGSGVTVVTQNTQGAMICRHGLTTDMNGVNTREISLVRQADALFLSVQQGMENSGLIGQPITATMVSTVETALTSILEQAVTNNVIVSYTNLTVAQEAYPGGDPTIIAATFQYAPAVPLNYIEVTFSIDLSNGLVATQSAQNAAASSTSTG
jgi:hypothetical protein